MTRDWLTIRLDEEIRQALVAMARADYRTPAQQLVWLARQEALQRGLLDNNSSPVPNQTAPAIEPAAKEGIVC